LLDVVFDELIVLILGDVKFIYFEKGERNKSVASVIFAIKGFDGEEPDAFKIWEASLDLRFVCEIWPIKNDEAEGDATLRFIKASSKPKNMLN
jgi:hypothetical protein